MFHQSMSLWSAIKTKYSHARIFVFGRPRGSYLLAKCLSSNSSVQYCRDVRRFQVGSFMGSSEWAQKHTIMNSSIIWFIALCSFIFMYKENKNIFTCWSIKRKIGQKKIHFLIGRNNWIFSHGAYYYYNGLILPLYP